MPISGSSRPSGVSSAAVLAGLRTIVARVCSVRLLKRSEWIACGLLAVLATSGITTVSAERADRNQPLGFAADRASVDEARQLNVLTGSVEITKGTMVVRADRVEVRQNRDGSQSAVASGGAGGRSYFRQKREGLDEFIEGEAERIEYDGQADTVRFVGRATMRRLRQTTPSDEIFGQTITYNNATGSYQVAGGPDSSAPSGRVRGVISPRAADPAAVASGVAR